MNSKEIKKLAQQHNIATRGLSQAELVRCIQRHEGNFDCFATAANGVCDQAICLWRDDCLAPPRAAA